MIHVETSKGPKFRVWDVRVSKPDVDGCATGSALWTGAVPILPALVGTEFHLQCLTLDPGANAGGFVVSTAFTVESRMPRRPREESARASIR